MECRKPSRATVKVRLLNTQSCTRGASPHLAFPLLGVLCDSWMLRDLLQKDLTLLQQEGLNDGEAALQDWLLSSSLYLSPVTSLALHSWRKKKAARRAGKSVRPAGVHPCSFPPALTCYPSKLAVFGLGGKVGIRDLIQIWSSKLLPERKQASRRTVTVQPLNFKLLLLSTCRILLFSASGCAFMRFPWLTIFLLRL